MTSNTLFISVAESTEIFFPIFQFGCCTAFDGLTIFNFFLFKFKNGPPDAVIKIFSICDVAKPLFNEYIEKCSESIGTKVVLFFF